MELNFEGFKMQKWNIPKDGAQRVDVKNGFNCLAMTFTNGVMVLIGVPIILKPVSRFAEQFIWLNSI